MRANGGRKLIYSNAARILYAVMPADIVFWQLVKRPSAWLVLAFLFFPFFSISTVAWLVLLMIIYHNDEYQLTNYILVFHASIFLICALYWSVKGFICLYLCSSSVHYTCLTGGPGVSMTATFKTATTILRLTFGWIAFILPVRLRERQSADVSLTDIMASPSGKGQASSAD